MFAVFDRRQLRHSPALELHNGGWVKHAEKASRAKAIADSVPQLQPARDFGMEPLLRVHARDYLHFLMNAHDHWLAAGRSGDAIGYTWPVVQRRELPLERIDAKLGRYSFDAATPICEGTWKGAYWSAQTALTALQPLLDGDARAAFALCRPPGHHSGADYLGGYCYLNNAAIAAQGAADAGQRIAILDIDYHHGNGTQDIFYERGDVLFVSIHADPATDYPFFWGHSDERGSGEGAGKTLNLPLPRGTGRDGYMAVLRLGLEAIEAHGSDLLIVSFGADTFEGDPISHFALGQEDYSVIAAEVASLRLRTLIVMEGGYAIEALGANVASFLGGFGN